MPAAVSILLPAHNAALTLEAAIRSCLSQTHENFELLVIDDGSSDGTRGLLQQLAAEDPRIRVLTQPHGGIVTALTNGLQQASGRYIARMDADDLMHPQRLEKQVKFLDANPGTGLVSCLVQHGGTDAQEGYAAYIRWINSLVTAEQIALNRFVESPLAHPSVLFRRTLVEKYGGYRNGNFPEDYELWLRWLEAGVRMEKIPELLLTWNDPPTRLSRTDARYSTEAFNRIKTGYLAAFLHERLAGRAVWLCGAGRATRRRSDLLLQEQLPLAGYIDVDPAKAGKMYHGLPVVGADALPPKPGAFIVSYVGSRGAREAIRALLQENGFAEGDDFILAG